MARTTWWRKQRAMLQKVRRTLGVTTIVERRNRLEEIAAFLECQRLTVEQKAELFRVASDRDKIPA